MADGTCSVDDCGRYGRIRNGLCGKHYERWRTHGDPVAPRQPRRSNYVTPECKVDGCDKPASAGRGWCKTHYQRWYKRPDRSDPAVAKYILGSESEQFWAKVNKDGPVPDYRPELGPCWLWTSGPDGKGYGQFSIRLGSNKRLGVRAHRYAYEKLVGPIEEGLDLDHLCRVHLCVNPAHLEPVTRITNINRGRDARGTAKQFKGVDWYSPTQRWRARIGKQHLGYFTDPVAAARAYDVAAIERWGDDAWLNFPDNSSR